MKNSIGTSMMDEVSSRIKKCCTVYLPKTGSQRFPLSTIAGWLIPDSHLVPAVAKMLDFMHIGVTEAEWHSRIMFLQTTIIALGYEVQGCGVITDRYAGVDIGKKTGARPDSRCQTLLDQASDRLQDELAKLCP